MATSKAGRADAVELWNALSGGTFLKAREIDMNARMIRAVCTEYPNHFLSTQAGYKRVNDATEEEIENAIADLRSRCQHMQRRADALEGVLRAKYQPGFGLMDTTGESP
ncbi:MAG: hypothetical protein KAI41_01005 [Hyphomicrobiaceae bacterium]|nr:hypothetical protein [Hyphomicrobiaceae bacterium]